MAQADKLKQILQEPFSTPVYYLASTEIDPLREAGEKVLHALAHGGQQADFTRIDGPQPDFGSIVEAAGTISFFGTPRVVFVREMAVSQLSDKDAAELAGLFNQLQNSILVVTALYKDKKNASTKKAKLLLEAAQKTGYAAELSKPTQRENILFIEEQAKELGAYFAAGAAQALLQQAGENRPLLKSETQKLAAICGYAEIPLQAVERYAAHNIEADVFELTRFITSGQKEKSYNKLAQLFTLKYEPIAIAAALAGTYIDMYRVRCGAENNLATSTIFKEMGYKGSDYRLKKAKENAARYSTAQLEECLLCLYELDKSLKSSALADKTILVEAALGTLLLTGSKAWKR